MEKQASDAERASIKYKQVEFMMDKTGIPFKAVISGFNEYGMFAEIEENLCEGMIRFREISFDYLVYDENNYCATGKRSKKTYRLGDEIIVEVKKADLNKKQLDFTLIHQNEYKGLS
jgi:ribonuclease R